MLFSGKPAEKKVVSQHAALIIDIGSGSVAAGVVEGKNVIFTIRQRFDSPERTDAKEILAALSTSLDSVLTSASKKARELSIKIGDAHVFYSSPWQVARTKSLSIEKPVAFEITQKIFDDIFAHEEKGEAAFAGLALVSQDILSVKINGYETHMPFGHKVKVLEAVIAMSFAPKELISLVEDSVHRNVAHIKPQHHSFDLSAFLALRHAMLIPRDLVLIHIHHRVTDLIIATKGMPREIVSFATGTSAIAKGIANFLHIDESIALSKIRMYADQKLQAEDEGMIKAALMQPIKDWLKPIDDFFASLSGENLFVPKKIYILGDSDLWHICRDALTESDFSKFSFSGESFDIEKIAAEGNDTNVYLEALYCSNI